MQRCSNLPANLALTCSNALLLTGITHNSYNNTQAALHLHCSLPIVTIANTHSLPILTHCHCSLPRFAHCQYSLIANSDSSCAGNVTTTGLINVSTVETSGYNYTVRSPALLLCDSVLLGSCCILCQLKSLGPILSRSHCHPPSASTHCRSGSFAHNHAWHFQAWIRGSRGRRADGMVSRLRPAPVVYSRPWVLVCNSPLSFRIFSQL